MPSIGTLVGFLRLDDSQYNRALKGAQSQTRAFAAGMTQAFLRIAGPAALTAGVVTLGKRALEAADRIDDLAARLNASFEGVQVLESLAKDFGNTADVFTQAGDKIQRVVAEAVSGNQKAISSFRALGISIEDIEGLKLEAQLAMLARAMVNATNQQQAFLDVAEIIGTRATPQLRAALVSLGTDGYDVLRKKTIESVGLLTEEQGKRLAEAKRQLEDFHAFLVTKAAQILSELRRLAGRSDFEKQIDFIVANIRRINELPAAQGVQLLPLLEKQVHDLADIVADSTDKATEQQIQAARRYLAYLTNVLDEAQLLTDDAARQIVGRHVVLENQLERLRDKRGEEEKKTAKETVAASGAVEQALVQQAERYRETSLETATARTAAENLELTLLRLSRALQEGTISQDAFNDGVAEAREQARPVRTALEQYNDEVARLDRLQRQGLISQDAYNDALRDAASAARPVKSPLEQYADEVARLDTLQRQGLITQQAYNKALRDARDSLVPPGSKPRGPSRPTPPNPPGSGMTNQEWKEFYRDNPEAGDAFREATRKPDPNSNEGKRQRDQERDEAWRRRTEGGATEGAPGAPETSPETTPGAAPDTAPPAEVPSDLPTEVRELTKQLKVIGEKLTVD